MKLGIGLIAGGAFWLLFDLSGGMNLFIDPFAVSLNIRICYHLITLALSLGMIVWGIRRVKSAHKRMSAKETK